MADGDYLEEPVRSSVYIVNSEKPFNAEPPSTLLRENLITPNDYFFVRNHANVPQICHGTYTVDVNGAVHNPRRFTMDDIYKLPVRVVTVTLSCAGNRRSEMSNIRPVKGIGWAHGAISNCVWEGPALRDILLQAGAADDPNCFVEFEGCDFPQEEKNDTGYTVSIPLSKALDNNGDVILAYKMNGVPLSPDHGYPLRVIVPGFIGARSVKWLKRISIRPNESQSSFQAFDYRLFPPHVDLDNVKDYLNDSTALAGLNVQSAICDPIEGQDVAFGKPYLIKGYAISDGHRIIRVDVSLDNGKTWKVAKLLPFEDKGATNRYWAWTFWELSVQSMPAAATISCRAWDSSSNTQPENITPIWNFLGLMNNAYHRINIKAVN